jgi:hypothetical protein
MNTRRFIVLVVLILSLISGLIPNTIVGATNPILHGKPVDIYFNDILVTDWGDALPFVDTISGRTMIPLRFYSEKIGCQVEWTQKDKKIVISYWAKDYSGNPMDMTVITLFVGNRKTSVNGKVIWLDSAPYQEALYPWRVFVPLRFVSSCLGDEVNWTPPGQALYWFPNITVEKDTVFLAHFVPVPPVDDYLIVPGERYGKYSLNMPLEQLARFRKPKRVGYIESASGKLFYIYNFVDFGCDFIMGKGVVLISVSTPYLNELVKYTVVGMVDVKPGVWVNLDDFLSEYPPIYIQKGTGYRNGPVPYWTLLYKQGITISVYQDYEEKKGWFIEWVGPVISQGYDPPRLDLPLTEVFYKYY